MKTKIRNLDVINMVDQLRFDHDILEHIDYACAVKNGEAYLICDCKVINTITDVAKDNNIRFSMILPWGV